MSTSLISTPCVIPGPFKNLIDQEERAMQPSHRYLYTHNSARVRGWTRAIIGRSAPLRVLLQDRISAMSRNCTSTDLQGVAGRWEFR